MTSPAAKTWGAEVRRWESTFTKPRSSVSTPAAARFSFPVLASQPTATTASAASACSGAAFRVKFIRTPDGVFSKESIRSRFSCTATPDARNASATAAETSSSSVGRMRGPLWKSCDLRAEGVEDRGDLNPGRARADAPASTAGPRSGPRRPVRARQLEAGDREAPARAARAEDDPVRPEPQPALGLDFVTCRRSAPRRLVRAPRRPSDRSAGERRSARARPRRPRARARAGASSRAPARSPRCRSGRAAGPRGSAGPRGPGFARERARRWPPCRRTPRA